METEYTGSEANEAKHQSTRSPANSPAANTSPQSEPADQSDSTASPREEGVLPNTGQQGFDQYENNSRPVQERRPAEDDELGEEMPDDYRREDFIQENELEQSDPDYRDGEDQYSENQDDEDALRNGK
jgi:hypothetical protein